MGTFLNILQFIVGVVVMLGGGYWLLKKVDSDFAAQIKTKVMSMLAKFKKD